VYIAEKLTAEGAGLGIAGERQNINAGLAVQLCRTFLISRQGGGYKEIKLNKAFYIVQYLRRRRLKGL
jgi:hypothetical protein